MSEMLIPRRTVLAAVGLGTAGALIGGSPAEAAVKLTVQEVQIRVAGWHTHLPITGVFDKPTHDAVRGFQRAHGLPPDGVVDAATHDRLMALAKPDGSTISFEWAQFASPDGSGFAGGTADEATVRERTRRLMYKLEALRHKLDGRVVHVTNGFHSTAHRARLRGAGDSTHTHGGTADITVAGLTTHAVHSVAQTCGFSGLGPWTQSWLHCDSGTELISP
ncbi:peptidoglycan-binding protein [Allorhizocola rhizosphaerae]|uniref:peptidoglycan-binding protein n=1 Tax=Allorhizocola rhizosphaerae TaxID=1872709 RepID=UPI0013C2C84B|nr:peptidoglycan-binding protein [Allorhizocola rhizosphaerae]